MSLIASATEILHALGLGERQVGRSHECDFPPCVRSLPVCTAPAIAVDGSSADIDARVKSRIANALSPYEVFTDVLEKLAPTHILTQTQCRVCAVSLDDVERALCNTVGSHPRLVSLEPNSLADIWLDIARVAEACDAPARGIALTAQLQSRIAAITTRAATAAQRPRTAVLEWMEPLIAAGNWLPELVALAGGDNLFGAAGRLSPPLAWEDLRAADPDVIIVAACGFDLARTESEVYWLTERPGWDELRAVRSDRVFLTDANAFMTRPGPRVVESLQGIAEMLHPDLFAPTLENVAWKRWSNGHPL